MRRRAATMATVSNAMPRNLVEAVVAEGRHRWLTGLAAILDAARQRWTLGLPGRRLR
jgi:hypothetical protein